MANSKELNPLLSTRPAAGAVSLLRPRTVKPDTDLNRRRERTRRNKSRHNSEFFSSLHGLQRQNPGTKTILLNLLLCLLVFYTLYYMFASICFGAFGLDSFDGLIPFDFKTPASISSSKYLVNLLSMEFTYFISGLLFAAIVKEWVWDYSLTVTLNHILLTSAVMVEFPLAWQWWLALGVGLFLMIGSGQLAAHFVCRNNPSYSLVNV